jgi:hypothetical protein
VLSAEAKLVWMEDWTMDRGGEGCWLSHGQLGERLGMTGHAVQYHRTRLEAWGLYERIKRPGARSPGWRPVVPVQCQLRTQRPTPAEVAKARTFLDLALRGKDPAGRLPDRGSQTSKTRRPDSQSPPARLSTVLSTAFDSQAVKQPSTALDSEGNRVSSIEQGQEAIDGHTGEGPILPQNGHSDSKLSSDLDPKPRPIDERPRQEVEEEGWERLRARHAEKRRQAGLG